MVDTVYHALAYAGGILALIFGITQSLRIAPRPLGWAVGAALAALFFGFSIYAIGAEGLLGFWTEHVRNAWGNQIWFDLLIAASVAFAFLVPRARAVGMKPLPWFGLIACTGSIGILAMAARCLFLERRV
jgi:hypothetical protein